MSNFVVNPYSFGGASTCTEQLLTGQTAGLEAPIYPLGQQCGQQFTSDAWFDLSKITKAEFSLKKVAEVHASVIIKCWLIAQADLNPSASIASFAKGQLGSSVNVQTDLTTSFSFITFEGSGLPDPTVADDMLMLEVSGAGFVSGDTTAELSDGSSGAISGTRFCSLSSGTFSPHANRNFTCKINCDG